MRNILIILMLMSGSLSAQNYIPYYNLTNEAVYRLMVTKEYEKAEKLYLEAFKLEKPFISDYLELARCYAGKGDSINMIKYLKLSSIDITFNPLLYVNSKKDSIFFYRYKEQQSFKKCVQEIESLNEKHKAALRTDNTLNKKRDTISYFLKAFQQNRKSLSVNFKDLTVNQKDSLKKIADSLDIIMRKSLFKYIDENGFPDYVAPGSMLSGSDFISVLLTSLTENEFDQYNSIMLRELKKGSLSPYEYGFIIDKIQARLKKEKCMYFSSNVNKDCWAKAIEERKKIGLSIYLEGSSQNIMKGLIKKLPWVGTLVN